MSAEEIKSAYRLIAKRIHPDVSSSPADAERSSTSLPLSPNLPDHLLLFADIDKYFILFPCPPARNTRERNHVGSD
jgi:hypothetical protein